MPRVPIQLPPLHPSLPGAVAPVRVDPTGRCGPTPKQARGPRWRRTAPGWYVPAGVDGTAALQRVVEAAVACPPGTAVTGWAALLLSGGRWFDGLGPGGVSMPVPVAVGRRSCRPWPGVRVSREDLAPADLAQRWGLRLTSPVASTAFEMRHSRTLLAAVQALDMAAFNDLVSLAEMAAHLAARPGRRGNAQAKAAVALADEDAWSPMEVLMRWVWTHEAGCPRPLANAPVFDHEGRLVGTPDLLDPVAGVYGEYDGDVHLVRAQRNHDVRREAALRALGLEPVTMLAADTVDASAFVARLHAAYERAGARPPGERRWTIEPPAWWRSTRGVAARRALPPYDRQRLLAHRRGPVPPWVT